MIETPVHVISPEEADLLIADIHSEAAHACALYDCGLLSREDRFSRVSLMIFDSLEQFLRKKNLRVRIAAGDWPVLDEAVTAWRKDGDPERLRACRWLFFPDNDESRGIHFGDEASVTDKARLLGILDACYIPFGFYRPVPEGIPCPDEHPGHFPNEIVVGFGIWEQDAGLVSGDFRIGEEKTLVDRHGLKTVFTILEHTPEGKTGRFHDGNFIGSGTVEGYTSSRPRKIRIYINYRQKRIDFLKFLMENDDYGLDFPLWRKYREDRAEITAVCNRAVQDMIEAYSHFL